MMEPIPNPDNLPGNRYTTDYYLSTNEWPIFRRFHLFRFPQPNRIHPNVEEGSDVDFCIEQDFHDEKGNG